MPLTLCEADFLEGFNEESAVLHRVTASPARVSKEQVAFAEEASQEAGAVCVLRKRAGVHSLLTRTNSVHRSPVIDNLERAPQAKTTDSLTTSSLLYLLDLIGTPLYTISHMHSNFLLPRTMD